MTSTGVAVAIVPLPAEVPLPASPLSPLPDMLGLNVGVSVLYWATCVGDAVGVLVPDAGTGANVGGVLALTVGVIVGSVLGTGLGRTEGTGVGTDVGELQAHKTHPHST